MTMRFKIRLAWNGTDVLAGRATMVCAVDTLAAHIRESFAGRDHKAYCETYLCTSDMIARLQAGESVVAAYSDDTGIATGEIIALEDGEGAFAQ